MVMMRCLRSTVMAFVSNGFIQACACFYHGIWECCFLCVSFSPYLIGFSYDASLLQAFVSENCHCLTTESDLFDWCAFINYLIRVHLLYVLCKIYGVHVCRWPYCLDHSRIINFSHGKPEEKWWITEFIGKGCGLSFRFKSYNCLYTFLNDDLLE